MIKIKCSKIFPLYFVYGFITETVWNALEILCTNHLYLKPEKCLFTQLKVEYLGLILSQGQVAMDPVKVSGVQDWLIPRNVTEVKSFLGFINFY